jgi:hypothetical protein
MRTQQENDRYLYNLATTMIQQLHIPLSMADDPSRAQIIYEKFSDQIKTKLLVMNPETRGRIADLGLSDYHDTYEPEEIPLYNVHCGSWLGKHESGRSLVTEIACTTIVCKIAEILWKESLSMQPASVEEELADVRRREPLD